MAKPAKPAASAKAKAKAKAKPKDSGAERRIPRLREQVQVAYDLLRDLLGRAGYDHLLEELKGLDTVNDVLRHRPESIPLLQQAAWELRHEKKFSQLFIGQESGVVVESRQEPIQPCGRTYAQVEQAHLYGSARLFFERLEVDFATKQARAESKAWRKKQAEKKKSGLTGRLMSGIKELTSDPPRFEAKDFRAFYPGYRLYDVLKPHLNHDWQFKLIPVYARLQTRQAEALGELITYFSAPAELDMLAGLTAQDISQARGFARVYAEGVLGFSRNQRAAAGDEAEDQMARLSALHAEEKRVFELLLTRYLPSLGPLREAGAGAETTVRRLAPVFKEDVFVLFQDPTALDNAINCPDFVLNVIGTAARSCPPKLSQVFNQIQDKKLTKDLLTLALETFSPEEVEEYMADPVRLPIWNALPAKFNNNYRYQADAPEDSTTLRNLENLRMVAGGIFDNLRSGRVEPSAQAEED